MFRNSTIVILLALAGCAGNQQVQRPQQLGLPMAGMMHIEVRLTQHEIMVATVNSLSGSAVAGQALVSPGVVAGGFAAGAAVGLIGALVDVAIDAHRNSVAEEAAKPMRAHMAQSHPDELVVASFSTLDKPRFAQEVTLEVIGRSEQEDLDHKVLEPAANVLVLTPSYFVSYDGSEFAYRLDARLVDRVRSPNRGDARL